MTLPDRDTLATYGGALANYSDVIDPTTDEDAGSRNKYAANVAMMTRTITRAARSFLGTTGGATAVADPTTGFSHDAVWGDGSASKASVTHVSTGTYDAIWPATVTDELDVSHSVNFRRARAEVESSDGVLRLASAKVTGAAKVRVYTYEAPSAGLTPALADAVGQVITVFVL
jgi:hypothetical protein